MAKVKLFKISGEMIAASNLAYPITNTTNKFFNPIYSLNLELALRMPLISRVTNTSNQSKAGNEYLSYTEPCRKFNLDRVKSR